MVSCEGTLALPGVTVVGVKVAVAPDGSPVAESVTGLANAPFCAATVIEYCADPPDVMVWDAVVEEMVKVGSAVPVPLIATACGDPDALSATDKLAVKDATDVGAKTTAIVQLLPASRELPQVFVCVKSVGLAPVMVMPVIVSGPLPVLDSVTV